MTSAIDCIKNIFYNFYKPAWLCEIYCGQIWKQTDCSLGSSSSVSVAQISSDCAAQTECSGHSISILANSALGWPLTNRTVQHKDQFSPFCTTRQFADGQKVHVNHTYHHDVKENKIVIRWKGWVFKVWERQRWILWRGKRSKSSNCCCWVNTEI